MMAGKEIDLRAAINAISDVVQNRPRPIRLVDQIYMKAADMVLQSELVAQWSDKKRLAFIGDGDAISVCVAYLQRREILEYGPAKITLYDFDERICSAVNRFADRERIDHIIHACLYNCLDPFPDAANFDCFYTNPPWGASNDGESVKVFVQRGMEAVNYAGEGMIVIADDEELEWPKKVLSATQKFSSDSGFFVHKMMPQVHSYHLDDAPDLRSCNLMIKALPGNSSPGPSEAIIDPVRLANFYGRGAPPKIKYIREKKRVDYGMASDDEYDIQLLEPGT